MTKAGAYTAAKPSNTERYIGLAVLAVLVTIGALIFRQQYRFNPALEVLDIQAGEQGSAAMTPAKGADGLPLPTGWKALTPPETFTADTLYEKIDGKAELYLSAGFRNLRTLRLAPKTTPDRWMEVFVYDMAKPENAFAVFGLQKRENALPLEGIAFGYRTENALYFTHGPYYVEIIGTTADENDMAAMEAWADAFRRQTKVASASLPVFERFPEQGRVTGRSAVIPKDAFGFEKLNDVYTTAYERDGIELTAFLSPRPTPEAAERLLKDYRRFLLALGGKEVPPPTDFPQAVHIELFDVHDIFFAELAFLGGVHEADNPDAALKLARDLRQKLREQGP